MAGDPDTAAYLTQNGTIANELGSLLALKNAGGTTVHDKLESAGLLDKNSSEEQQKKVLKVLLQEAENGRAEILKASANLYRQTDPLQQNPNNPLRKSPVSSSGVSSYNNIKLPSATDASISHGGKNYSFITQ